MNIAKQLRQIADHLDESGHDEKQASITSSAIQESQDSTLDFGAIAEEIYRARRHRDKIFGIPGMFEDPAWDILLDLLVGERRGRRVSVKNACIASCVPQTTALRWLSALEKHGLVERSRDAVDARRCFIQLTPLGRRKVCKAVRDEAVQGVQLSPRPRELAVAIK
jgi:hypothetical protein